MGPEAETERKLRAEAKADGWLVYKVRWLDTNGAPDRLFGKKRRGVFIEVKAPGEEPTRQQLKRHRELRECFGYEVHWIDNIEDGRRILGIRGT